MSHQPCSDCGSSDALKEYAENTYCFSCNTSTQKKKPTKQGKSYFPVMYEEDPSAGYYAQLRLPRTMTTRLPTTVLAWFLFAGLDKPLREKYGIGYVYEEEVDLIGTKYKVDMSDRIIFPSYDANGVLEFYQGRTGSAAKPKYLTNGSKGLFWSH